METHPDLVTGRLGVVRPEPRGGAQPPPYHANTRTSYRASRLGLAAEVRDPSEEPRPALRGSRRLRAARRSARLGWATVALLVVGSGLGAYLVTARLVQSFSRKLERMATQVRRQVLTISNLEQQRGRLEAGLATGRANLSMERTLGAKTRAQLEASVTRLVEAINERDQVRATLSAEQSKTAKITAQLEVSVARLVDAMTQRDKVRADLSTEQGRTAKIAAQLEASVAKLVDAMKERDRARDQSLQAVREASKAEVRLELIDKRLRSLTERMTRLKKALGASSGASTQPATQSFVLDLMLTQFRADVERFRKALQGNTPPPAAPPAEMQ